MGKGGDIVAVLLRKERRTIFAGWVMNGGILIQKIWRWIDEDLLIVVLRAMLQLGGNNFCPSCCVKVFRVVVQSRKQYLKHRFKKSKEEFKVVNVFC